MYAILVRAGVLENAQTASELAVTGSISFALTVLNIVCIWVAGMLMFAIKVSQFLLSFCWCATSSVFHHLVDVLLLSCPCLYSITGIGGRADNKEECILVQRCSGCS